MKTDNHNITDPPDRRHYKKKYILRKHEELEAEAEIKRFEDVPTPEQEEPQQPINREL